MCKGLAALPATCLERAKGIKTKLGILLQKPELITDYIIPYSDKTEKLAKPQRPSQIEAMKWRESLEKLLMNNYGQVAFKTFLQSEHSEENIEFWMACEDFKATKSPIQMVSKAKKIYEDFMEKEAPKEINVDHYTKEVTVKCLAEPSTSTFELAQKRVLNLMEKDSFSRFLKSELYLELIK
ncbi:regulator of G-protein signaling 5-like [Scyliorhinus canicula]|uniref:regulator of G-protein signaling 5-like n=1 Tax=Scyliorhinus canicula TaxID=7830 RepID=UPI0018F6D6C4|nr:regulator of G-protein signaling 5-like [Scyliorhinus canicula]